MAKATVTHTEVVQILSTRVKKSTNELMVEIDKPWWNLTDEMHQALFEAAAKLAQKHKKLEMGYSFDFYCKE